MPDITMCKGEDCPIKDNCYRHTANPSEFLQSWFVKAPIQDTTIDEFAVCEHFWNNQDEV